MDGDLAVPDAAAHVDVGEQGEPDQQRGESGVREIGEGALELVTHRGLEGLHVRHLAGNLGEDGTDASLRSGAVGELPGADDVADERVHLLRSHVQTITELSRG